MHFIYIIRITSCYIAYHGYMFLKTADGTILGPDRNDGYIDMMHAGIHHIKVIDDRKWPLAFLLQQPGDTCLYTYDLGDNFEHILLLEEVHTGAVCIYHTYTLPYA